MNKDRKEEKYTHNVGESSKQPEKRKQISPTIGLFLKKLRVSNNFKQAVVAEAVGVSQAYIGLIEKGMRLPSVEVLKSYAEVFTSVSIEELLNLREMTIFETVDLLGDDTPPAIKNERNMLVHSLQKSENSFVAESTIPYSAEEKEQISVKIIIKKDGSIEIGGKPVEIEDLPKVLNDIKEKHIPEQK